jgi:hypothetical protein
MPNSYTDDTNSAITGVPMSAMSPIKWLSAIWFKLSAGVTAVIGAGSAIIGKVGPAAGSFTDRSGTITTGSTAQTLAAANANRQYLFIQNNSASDLWINFTTTAVLSQPSIKLASGTSMTFVSYLTTEAVSIIGATTGQTFTAKEG